MTDLTTLTQNDLAILGAAVFTELNRRTAEHNRKMLAARRIGLGWITPEQIDDAPLLELLEAVVAWDDDAKGSLENIRLENGMDADGEPIDDEPTFGRVRLSDVEFDFATSRGVSA